MRPHYLEQVLVPGSGCYIKKPTNVAMVLGSVGKWELERPYRGCGCPVVLEEGFKESGDQVRGCLEEEDLYYEGGRFSNIVTCGNVKIENVTNKLVADEISRQTVEGVFQLLLAP